MQQHNKQQPEHSINLECRGKTETTINRSRRKALKTLAVGTAAAGAMALTSKWSKPVVDTIILPAHAQATNGAAPVGTTTPAPTTTSGECSPVLGPTCIEIVRDQQTELVTSATVTGTVIPAQAGIEITAAFRSFSPTNGSHRFNFSTTTDAAGAFSVGQTFSLADQVTEIDAGFAGTSCGGTDIGLCANGG